MKTRKTLSVLIFLVVGAVLLAQAPYATIVYAEGQQFSLIRGGMPVSYRVENPEVFGLAIERGDILQTGPDTHLEISIQPISASVQIAENTSFRCDADESGMNSRGELYYGRVRAKVSKLTGSSSYRIRSPALVAGVRGTDFGLDHILIRAPVLTASAASAEDLPVSTVLNRAFCFDGSVLVAPAADTDLEHVVIGGGEMIEATTSNASIGVLTPVSLEKEPVSPAVTEFWKGREFRSEILPDSSEQVLASDEPLTEEEIQVVEQEKKRVRNHKVRLGGSFALFLGGALVAGLAYPEYQDEGFTDSVMANVGFGGVLISTSLGLLLYDLINY